MKLTLFLTFLFSISLSVASVAEVPKELKKELFFIEIAPTSTSDYIVSTEGYEYSKSLEVALKQFKKNNASCSFDVQIIQKNGSEDELFKTVKSISSHPTQKIIVGMSRTNFARVAALAAKDSPTIGISMGASTTKLREINPKFVSIASPWTSQWQLTKNQMKNKGCSKETTLGIFDPSSANSSLLKQVFISDLGGVAVDTEASLLKSDTSIIHKYPCVFLAINLAEANSYISLMDTLKSVKQIFGPSEWNAFDKELDSILKTVKRADLNIFMPTGWVEPKDKKSKKIISLLTTAIGKKPSPLAVYVFDSVILAQNYLCNGKDPNVFDKAGIEKLSLLRQYEQIASSGNYLSRMHMLLFTKDRGKREVFN